VVNSIIQSVRKCIQRNGIK